MLRGKVIIKRDVIAQDTGERVGRVNDLVIDRSGRQILGFVVSERSFLGGDKVVPWTAVLSVGIDTIIVESKTNVVKASELPEIADVLDQGYVLVGSRIQTTAGREVGRIENFYFDPQTGAVEGFELSGAAHKLRESGSAFLPVPDSFQAGKDYSFIDPAAVDTIEDLSTALRRRGTQVRV